MDDHYELLGVSREASSREIKSAFRVRAKTLHPDLAQGSGDDPAMRLLLEAYRTLLDPERRLEYDRALRKRRAAGREGPSFDYRAWLRERLETPEYRAKLIIYDLLHDLDDEALELYESLQGLDDGRLERFFERSEAMDAEFCIAEEYERRERYVDAFRIYRKLLLMERSKPTFGYFLDVVGLRFRRLVLEGLREALEEAAYLEILAEAAQLALDPHDAAQFFRRKAEIRLRSGDAEGAWADVCAAKSLAPRLAGLAVLERRVAASPLRPTGRA